MLTRVHEETPTSCPCECGQRLRANQKYASDACRKRVARAVQPVQAELCTKELFPCSSCKGLILASSPPTDVCNACRPESRFTGLKVSARPDDPLRPCMVYWGSMNIQTRYADQETVYLVCGYPDALEPLTALANALDGVAIVKPGPTGVPMLEAFIPLERLKPLMSERRVTETPAADARSDSPTRADGSIRDTFPDLPSPALLNRTSTDAQEHNERTKSKYAPFGLPAERPDLFE